MNSVEESKDVSIDKKRDWVEVGLKIFTPIITGLLIAWAGFVGNYTLTDISNKEQIGNLYAILCFALGLLFLGVLYQDLLSVAWIVPALYSVAKKEHSFINN